MATLEEAEDLRKIMGVYCYGNINQGETALNVCKNQELKELNT